jgi:uroporphyrinogen-III decarboxylase
MKSLLDRKLEAIELGGKQHFDLIECGGGGGSSTVISPDMHKEFCLPYDKIQIDAFHQKGTKVVYHLCGGLMPLLETVVENGSDALETMTPIDMGGDCDFAEAVKRVGDKIAFIGGFDQNKGFERGNPALIREMVFELFGKKPNGGFICSPSDHFFFGDPENVEAFVKAARECIY